MFFFFRFPTTVHYDYMLIELKFIFVLILVIYSLYTPTNAIQWFVVYPFQ
jgi:hypothetical protein